MQKLCVNVKNMPVFVNKEPGEYFLVARVDEITRELWYYGNYPTKERAVEVANEIGNGIVLNLDISPIRTQYEGYLIEYEPECFSVYNPQNGSMWYVETFTSAKESIDKQKGDK